MSDLPQDNPRSNPYFRNRRIRRVLIRYGLINRQGEIISVRSRPKVANDQNGDQEQKRIHRSTLRSPGRAKSARHASRDLRSSSRRPSAKPKPPEKTRCRVIMTYLRPQTTIEYDKSWFQHEGDEIVVMQQHCGGENLTVFKGFVKPQETFAFDSQRHSDYPFALALYINGLIDCRVSVCCEYKHKKNVPLGGPSGSFAISDVQKVKPCRSCRFERLKKKPKSTISLGIESGRYVRSVVPRIPSRHSTPSPGPPSPPKNGHASDGRAVSVQSLEGEEKRPQNGSVKASSPSASRKSPSSLEEDDKKPSPFSTKHDSSVGQKTYNARAKSPSLSSSSDDDDKKKTKPIKSAIPIHRSTSGETSDSSEKSSQTLEGDDKRPEISSSKPPPPTVPTRHSKSGETPDSSRRSSPTLEGEDKRPEVSSSSKPPPPATSKGFTSTIENLIVSQKNGNDTENYEPDFDESNDDDDNQPSNSRYGRPRISDSYLSDNGNNNGVKHSLRSPKPSDSTDDEINRKSSAVLNGKEKPIVHMQKASSSSLKKSGHSENETDQYTSAERPSPRKFGSSSPDKTLKVEETRPVSSSSTEDFFGIKRSSSKEQNKTTPGLASDWFETTSRNDPDENDSTPKAKSWEKILFSDNDN